MDKKKQLSNKQPDEGKEIAFIVNKRIVNGKGGKVEYLVRWSGFNENFDSWVSEQDIENKSLYEEFNENRSTHVKKIFSSYQNSDGSICYDVSLDNGMIERYPSSFLKRHHPQLLVDYFEKYYLFSLECPIEKKAKKKH